MRAAVCCVRAGRPTVSAAPRLARANRTPSPLAHPQWPPTSPRYVRCGNNHPSDKLPPSASGPSQRHHRTEPTPAKPGAGLPPAQAVAAAMEAPEGLVKTTKDFCKGSYRLVKRCTKPDKKGEERGTWARWSGDQGQPCAPEGLRDGCDLSGGWGPPLRCGNMLRPPLVGPLTGCLCVAAGRSGRSSRCSGAGPACVLSLSPRQAHTWWAARPHAPCSDPVTPPRAHTLFTPQSSPRS